jgi:hypothetical protein
MLEGLDKIDWKNLGHAYGEATDVPDLIQAFASKNKKKRNDALQRVRASRKKAQYVRGLFSWRSTTR